MDNIDMMGEVDIITSEQVAEQEKADKEASLVAEGTWEGLVLTWNKVPEEEKGEKNPYHGVPLYRVGIMFYDCPEAGKKKSGFFNMTSQKVLNENGRPRAAYTTMLGLAKAINMVGHSVGDVLEQAKVTRAKYKVGQFAPADGNPVNYLKAVSGV